MELVHIKPDKLVTRAEIQAFPDIYPPSQMSYLFDQELGGIVDYLLDRCSSALKINDYKTVFETVVKGYGCPLGTGRCFFKDVLNIDIFEKIDMAPFYQGASLYEFNFKKLYENLAKNEKSIKIPKEAFLSKDHVFSFRNVTLVEFPEEFTEIGVNKLFNLQNDVNPLCIKGPATLKTMGLDFRIEPARRSSMIGAFKTEKINSEEVSTFEISKDLYNLLKRLKIEFGGY